MNYAVKPYEKKLHEIWSTQDFNSTLNTIGGEEVKILDCGVLNEDTAGPDFLNARIRVGNLVYVGDIEIDSDYNDWKNHGHNIDNKHNKVILHVSLLNNNSQHYVYTKDGRRVPTICLNNYLDKKKFDELQEQTDNIESNNNQIKCSHLAGEIEFQVKKKFISNLGIERFKKKCEKIELRLKEILFIQSMNLKEPVIQYDLKPEFEKKEFTNSELKEKLIWQQLIYELIFEALGYSKNKMIMQRLAMSADIRFLNKLGHDAETARRFESALYRISGILPDSKLSDEVENSNYIKSLRENWDIIKRIYDGQIFNKEDWHFFKLRPQNFPTIRIAAGVILLQEIMFNDLLGAINKKIKEIRNVNVLVNSIRSLFVIKSKGFWKNHYVFEQSAKDEIKYFVGAARADEIVVNVILPFYYVYYNIFADEEMAKKILKIYNLYDQRADNKIVREVAEGLHAHPFLKKTILIQGMLELFRSYCSKKRCLDCEIGKLIFN